MGSMLWKTTQNIHIDCFRGFYGKQTDCTCKLLLVQCESANENVEMLDSIRYIIQRENHSERGVPTHNILLLNIPRGHTFTGYQGNFINHNSAQCVLYVCYSADL